MSSGRLRTSPRCAPAEHYEAIFTEGRAEFRRRDLDIETHTEIVVSPEDDIELRRVRITNRSRSRRTIEITSYAEVVLAPPAADALHSGVQQSVRADRDPCRPRRPFCARAGRARATSTRQWLVPSDDGARATRERASFETDRVRFIGRGGTLAAPRAMVGRGALSGSTGSVLDPIAAIRQHITLDAERVGDGRYRVPASPIRATRCSA